MTQQMGTVERLTDKGYGFIRTDAERTRAACSRGYGSARSKKATR